MLRIERIANGDTVFRLIGRLNAETIPELRVLLQSEGEDRLIELDLKDLTLVDRDAVSFLDHCEMATIALVNCPPYIREWIERERSAV